MVCTKAYWFGKKVSSPEFPRELQLPASMVRCQSAFGRLLLLVRGGYR